MAYDETLAERVREQLGTAPFSEQRMFGGLAFLVGGHMAIAASGRGGLLVRADPAESERLVAEGAAEPMVMRGSPMRGWLHVSTADVAEDDALARWVAIGTRYAGSLPPKGRGRR